MLPSRDIGCVYVAKPAYPRTATGYLACDVDGGLKPSPPRPKSCEFEWAVGGYMYTHGKAYVGCASNSTFVPSATPVLGYGMTWRGGGFTCVARWISLTCRNRDGHGWFLSRRHSYLF